MKKTVTVVVPEWVSEEEVRLWIVEGMGRKLVRRLVLEGLSEEFPLSEREIELFEEARERAWRKILKMYAEKGVIE